MNQFPNERHFYCKDTLGVVAEIDRKDKINGTSHFSPGSKYASVTVLLIIIFNLVCNFTLL